VKKVKKLIKNDTVCSAIWQIVADDVTNECGVSLSEYLNAISVHEYVCLLDL